MAVRDARFLFGFLVAALVGGCAASDDSGPDAGLPDGPGLVTGDPCEPAAPPTGEAASCAVTLRYRPPRPVQSVHVSGAWNSWSGSAEPLQGPDEKGEYSIALRLPPGDHGYKLVLDGKEWRLDDNQPYRHYDAGVENSGLRVADCHRPQLRLVPGTLAVTRDPARAKGTF